MPPTLLAACMEIATSISRLPGATSISSFQVHCYSRRRCLTQVCWLPYIVDPGLMVDGPNKGLGYAPPTPCHVYSIRGGLMSNTPSCPFPKTHFHTANLREDKAPLKRWGGGGIKPTRRGLEKHQTSRLPQYLQGRRKHILGVKGIAKYPTNLYFTVSSQISQITPSDETGRGGRAAGLSSKYVLQRNSCG